MMKEAKMPVRVIVEDPYWFHKSVVQAGIRSELSVLVSAAACLIYLVFIPVYPDIMILYKVKYVRLNYPYPAWKLSVCEEIW